MPPPPPTRHSLHTDTHMTHSYCESGSMSAAKKFFGSTPTKKCGKELDLNLDDGKTCKRAWQCKSLKCPSRLGGIMSNKCAKAMAVDCTDLRVGTPPTDWESSTKASCQQYKDKKWCTLDGKPHLVEDGGGWKKAFGDFAKWANKGKNAAEACCVCGGGSSGGSGGDSGEVPGEVPGSASDSKEKEKAEEKEAVNSAVTAAVSKAKEKAEKKEAVTSAVTAAVAKAVGGTSSSDSGGASGGASSKKSVKQAEPSQDEDEGAGLNDV